jgi:hypothetical protein
MLSIGYSSRDGVLASVGTPFQEQESGINQIQSVSGKFVMSPVINTRNLLKVSSRILLGLGLGLGLLNAGQSIAAGPASSGAAEVTPPVPDQVLGPADKALAKDVSILENRFFFHQYGHDPMEKRLERLELLTLGAAQGGGNPERLARLKQAVVERDRVAAKTIAREQKGDGEMAAKTNYPILGTLEWRVLKKTYPSESIDQRLARMESQLFGVPAQAMSYVDRIDRLKKTIGMDIATAPQVGQKSTGKNQIGLNGPLPRANRSGMPFQINQGPPTTGNRSGYLYDSDGNVTGWYQNNTQSWSFPGNSNALPGQSSGQNVFEAMDQMNRQMNEMFRHLNNPGAGGIGGFGGLDDNPFSIQIGPEGISRSPFQQSVPGQPRLNQGKGSAKDMQMPSQQSPKPKKFTAPKEELPAYTDPNSI